MMKPFCVFLSATILFLCGCQSEFNSFNEEAITYATNDKRIDNAEYDVLIDMIQKSDDKGFQAFKKEDGSVNNDKVCAYLLKLFAAKRIAMTSADICPSDTPSSPGARFNVNVFLENSASIDGYVGDNSSFKITLFKLLTDIKNSPSTDSLNLNYINTKPIPIKISASRDDIDDFYKRLNPANFRIAGGTRQSTDIERMLKQLLDKVDSNNLSVFISDCVFSPGNADAKKYLDGQYAAIYNDFVSSQVRNKDLAITILQCKAQFDGTYFDYLDVPHPNISMIRPYYIWFIGTAAQMVSLVDYKLFDLLKDGYENKVVVQTVRNVDKPSFKILYRPRIGDFDPGSLAQGVIRGARAVRDDQHQNLFGFSIAVDFSKSLQDTGFYLDASNYELSDPTYNLSVGIVSNHAGAALRGYTHIMSLQTSQLSDETIEINVVGKTPSWVYTSTSTDDSKISDDKSEYFKTFGLKYLVEGVCDAFYPKSKSNVFSSISITIQR
jgi:hypothetical protein